MAYGKGDKNVFRRSIPSGKTMLDPGMLTAGKMGDLLIIRRKFLAAANSFVDAAFLPEPLASTRNGEDVHAVLTALQKNMDIGFNKAYVEKARLALRIDDQIDEKKLKQISEFTRGEALDYLKNYSHPNDNVVERIRFNGRGFLRNINDSCKRIEKLKSQIDTGYNNLNKLKSIICGYLGLDEREQFAEGQDPGDPYIRHIHKKFFRLLHHLVEMKKKRLSFYKKTAGVKKSWFGYLSNQETILARKYHAAIVREDLSILAREKNDPGYKGRTFNKMINNGSKGQYIRRASDKLQWDGIPEIVIPSYHTSSCCTVHSLVDASMRNGETFFCPRCGAKEHADSHAADTIGNYILLRPNIAKQVTLLLPRDRQSSGNLLCWKPQPIVLSSVAGAFTYKMALGTELWTDTFYDFSMQSLRVKRNKVDVCNSLKILNCSVATFMAMPSYKKNRLASILTYPHSIDLGPNVNI